MIAILLGIPFPSTGEGQSGGKVLPGAGFTPVEKEKDLNNCAALPSAAQFFS